MASLRRCYGRELVWNNLLIRSNGIPRQAGMASTFANQKIYNLLYSYFFGSHNGLILRLTDSKRRILKSVLEKIALNIQFLENNKFKMMKFMKNYMNQKHIDGVQTIHANKEIENARLYQFDENNILQQKEIQHPHRKKLSNKQKRHKQQINGITRHTKTLSPRKSLMLMITLFFVIIGCCLISLWLYSVHKNTLII